MKKPYETLLEYWGDFLAAYAQHGGKKATHDALKAAGHPVGGLQFNSIKSLIPALMALDDARMKVIDDLNEKLAMTTEVLDAVSEGYGAALTLANTPPPNTAKHAADQHVGAILPDVKGAKKRSVLYTVYSDKQHDEANMMDTEYVTRSEVTAMIKRACSGRSVSNRPSNTAPKKQRDESVPDHYETWRVAYSRNSYRLSKRLGDRVITLYIGALWDAEKAALKLEQWRMKQASEGGNDDQ